MILYMDSRRIVLPEEDLEYLKIDRGNEGTVYFFEDYALKVYHPTSRKIRLDESSCKEMIQVPTHNILLPRGVLYDQRKKFNGYYTEYIPVRHAMYEILSMKMREFIEKVEDVYQELLILADNHISVYDFHPDNFIYDLDFFFVDPGSYIIEIRKDFYQLLLENQEVWRDFIIDHIFSGMVFGKNKKKQTQIKDHFSDCLYLPDVLHREALPNETVKQYAKRIAS